MEKEWTIIFLIYADFREENGSAFKRELNSVFSDLKNCPLDSRAEIIVIQNIIDPKQTDPEKNDITTVSRVIANGNDKNKFTEIDSISTRFIVQKAEKLGGIFKKIHTNGFIGNDNEKLVTRARRYFLITWDHGSAFGIFRRDKTSPPVRERKAVTVNTSENINGLEGVNSLELIQEKEMLINFVPNSKGIIEKRVRYWEKPVYNYYTEDNNYLFKLNTRNEAESFFQRAIEDKQNSITIDLNREHETCYFGFKNNGTKDAGNGLEALPAFGNEAMEIAVPAEPPKILDILTNEELQRAIRSGFGNDDDNSQNKSIDVLMMMNCAMLNIHTCYALKNDVRYLVAPQGTISLPGYHYSLLIREIVRSLRSAPLEPLELAKLCVLSSGWEFSKKRATHKDKIEQWVIMAVDMQLYDKVCDSIDRMAAELIRMNEDPTINVENDHVFFDKYLSIVRNRCIRFDDLDCRYFMIDLSHWISRLIQNLKTDGIDAGRIIRLYNEILELVDEKIIVERIGSGVFGTDQNQFILKRPKGLCIYFPDQKFENEEFNFFIDRNSEFQSAFLREKPMWLQFLETAFLK